MTELTFVVAPDFSPSATPVAIPRVQVQDEAPVIQERVTIRPLAPVTPNAKTTHLAVSGDQWGWAELRDYVVSSIEKITGPFPRNETKEMGIFKSFVSRWGSDATPIARYAFETMGGFWKNAPVSVSRFCKASDPYFAQPIVDHLNRNVR